MFVKITNGQVDQYPYTIGKLRKENPNTSFPKSISNEILARYGVYPVTVAPSPEYNSRTQRLVSQLPTLIDGVWTATQTVVSKEQNQIDAEATQQSFNVRSERDKRLKETDWRFRSDMNPSQDWIDYCQALRDVPSQEGFPWDVTWPTQPE